MAKTGRPRLGRDESIDVKLTPTQKERFKEYCAARKRSMTDVINDFIADVIGPDTSAPKQLELTTK